MQTLDQLRITQKNIELAMEANNITIFELDIATHTACYAQHSKEAFGLADVKTNAPEGFIEQGIVAKGYEDIFRDIYTKIYEGQDHSSAIIQAKMADGSIVWNRITLTALKNKNGISVKALGSVEDITKEILLQYQLDHKV